MAASDSERLEEICNDLRQQLFRKGTKGLSGVARIFRQADFNGNKKLDREEFEEALSFAGLFLKSAQVSFLFNAFDLDGDGNINYDEFLHGIQSKLSGDRLDIVNKVFDQLDRDDSGIIDVRDITGIYDASKHPDVEEGKKTEEEILTGFLMGFERGTKDGRINRKEFQNYYEDLGASIPSDEYFVAMMESCWKLTSAAASKSCELGTLVGLLKKKIAQKTKTGQRMSLTLKKVFQFFDEDESGHIKKSEFSNAMTRFGIPLTDKQLEKFFKFFAGSDGKISTAEFISKLDLDE